VRVRNTDDYYVGSTGLNDNASSASGASLVGLYDNSYFNISANTNLQGAIGELDFSIGARTYTNNRYVSNSQILTTSIDILDQALYQNETGATGLWRDAGSYIYPANYTQSAITDSGNLGIGTSAPAVSLEVVG
jgi:hypothetical protein